MQIVAQKLAEADHPISTRRAVQITRNIVAVAAALQVLRARVSRAASEDAFYTALRYSLPDAAWGNPVPQTTLLTAHRAAWQLAKLDQRQRDESHTARARCRSVASRSTLASSLKGGEAGRIVVDAFSSLSRVARLATAAVLAPLAAQRTDLPVADD